MTNNNLSPRQISLIKLLCEHDELPQTELAARMNISIKTLEREMTTIYAALYLTPKNRIGIYKYACKAGLVQTCGQKSSEG